MPAFNLSAAAVLAVRQTRRWLHAEVYIGIDDAPPGVAAEAAAVLRQFGLPKSALALLVR